MEDKTNQEEPFDSKEENLNVSAETEKENRVLQETIKNDLIAQKIMERKSRKKTLIYFGGNKKILTKINKQILWKQ